VPRRASLRDPRHRASVFDFIVFSYFRVFVIHLDERRLDHDIELTSARIRVIEELNHESTKVRKHEIR
jgi:hypothetical protein